MSKVVDLFGIKVGAGDPDWAEIVRDQHCPYLDKKCIKIRKSQPEISIGTCTVRYGKEDAPVMICPFRLLERKQIFTDCLHLLTGHEPGNEIHILPEISVPGGNVDYVLVSARDGKVRDFVGIELQTLDTTGTVWPARQQTLATFGLPHDGSEVRKSYGMNWKMTAKTILVQLHHKISTFEHVNKHLVLVIQEDLLRYMRREFSFSHLSSARVSDPMHFHSYRYHEGEDRNRISLVERVSTDTDGISVCLGLQSEANVEIEKIFAALEARMSSLTRWEL